MFKVSVHYNVHIMNQGKICKCSQGRHIFKKIKEPRKLSFPLCFIILELACASCDQFIFVYSLLDAYSFLIKDVYTKFCIK